jgi:hypothetical protein
MYVGSPRSYRWWLSSGADLDGLYNVGWVDYQLGKIGVVCSEFMGWRC